jgi:DNA-binding CsgD family transcriptional regulator
MNEKEHLDLLESIKKLLVLQLIKQGTTPEEIAVVLRVTPKTIRNIVPMRKVKK